MIKVELGVIRQSNYKEFDFTVESEIGNLQGSIEIIEDYNLGMSMTPWDIRFTDIFDPSNTFSDDYISEHIYNILITAISYLRKKNYSSYVKQVKIPKP